MRGPRSDGFEHSWTSDGATLRPPASPGNGAGTASCSHLYGEGSMYVARASIQRALTGGRGHVGGVFHPALPAASAALGPVRRVTDACGSGTFRSPYAQKTPHPQRVDGACRRATTFGSRFDVASARSSCRSSSRRCASSEGKTGFRSPPVVTPRRTGPPRPARTTQRRKRPTYLRVWEERAARCFRRSRTDQTTRTPTGLRLLVRLGLL